MKEVEARQKRNRTRSALIIFKRQKQNIQGLDNRNRSANILRFNEILLIEATYFFQTFLPSARFFHPLEAVTIASATSKKKQAHKKSQCLL